MEQPESTDKVLAAVAHLGFLTGVGYFFAALIIWLLKKDSPFVASHAKQAMVWQASCFGVSAVLGVAGFIFSVVTAGIGTILVIPAMGLLGLMLLIPSIIATFKVFAGEEYDYPVSGGWARNL